ncbi:MAG: AmmeMemoRadiSam system protein A [Woeseiaceae bacterium]
MKPSTAPARTAVDASLGAEILRIARASIGHGFEHGVPLPVDGAAYLPALAEPAATFTTLRLDGELRGCCGRLEAIEPLANDVAYSSFRAAFADPRFVAVVPQELEVINLEVSVLSALEPVTANDEADLLVQLVPGIDGLVIAEGARRATFLPKVWDSLSEPRMFLAALKAKSGLPADYWSDKLEFLRYTTVSYSEAP